MEKKNDKEMLKLSEIDINKCFIDDANGFWDGFWERRNGLGAAPVYADPDSASETLRNYHQALWSRKLPNGEAMTLQKGKKSDYLTWNGMRFASDSIATQHRYIKCEQVIEQVKLQLPNYKNFVYDTTRFTYTIGGMIIFPKLRGSMNQDRGTNPMIADRWDLSLECIKRYYEHPENDDANFNPLWNTIKRSEDFFKLFVDFSGYVEFFFLQDFLDEDGNVIRFLNDYMDENGLFTKKYPLPQTVEEYLRNIEIQKEIVSKRNKRIKDFVYSEIHPGA